MPVRDARGLTSTEAAKLLGHYGPNAIETKKPSLLRKVTRWLASPMSLLLLAASILSFYVGNRFDGWFILALFVGNFLIAQWHEGKADQAIATLQKKLAVTTQTLRDGVWVNVPATNLVPGDAVRLGVGNIVPADIMVLTCKNLSINEAALTGESLPEDKQAGGTAYTGSFITTGNMVGIVAKTGRDTKFGATVTMVDSHPKHSLLERDILTITRFLTAVSIVAAAGITAYFLARRQPVASLLTLDVSILIAGIPVAMPTVMSLIISLGVLQLTRRHAIVRRLSSLEDLANVNLLLSDKTGTLTKNQITVERVIAYGAYSRDDVAKWAVSATADNKMDAINEAVVGLAGRRGVSPYPQVDFTPADSLRKHSTAVVTHNSCTYTVALGAAQIVETLCRLDNKTLSQFRRDVSEAAAQGYRALAVAVGEGRYEKNLHLAGMLLLSDTLRADAANVISFLHKHGVEVKMMTGDNHAIAARVADELRLGGTIMQAMGKTAQLTADDLDKTGVFAEVLPDDKFRIVGLAARRYVVAATGDGVNDLPALRRASVGIAVNSAVDALKSAADIVLTTNGIGVIRDAIVEARKIFARTYYYSVYRISESFRLILTIALISIINGTFPLTPVQIILLALLNDLPIISLAYDRVAATAKPAAIHVRERFALASIYGLIGIAESITLFYVMKDLWMLPTPVIQTMFFLKLAVSGHMLIYVAHTRKRWWRWLPSKQVLLATILTQAAATIIALAGVLFAGITIWEAAAVWAWAFAWMQLEEVAKAAFQRFFVV